MTSDRYDSLLLILSGVLLGALAGFTVAFASIVIATPYTLIVDGTWACLDYYPTAGRWGMGIGASLGLLFSLTDPWVRDPWAR